MRGAPSVDGHRLGNGREDVVFPAADAAVGSYLNLALAIAPVCAAVISNARSVEEIETARALLERSNADLEGMCAECASAFDPPGDT